MWFVRRTRLSIVLTGRVTYYLVSIALSIFLGESAPMQCLTYRATQWHSILSLRFLYPDSWDWSVVATALQGHAAYW